MAKNENTESNRWKYYTLPEYKGEERKYVLERKTVALSQTKFVNSFKTLDDAFGFLVMRVREGFGVKIGKKIKYNCEKAIEDIINTIKEKEKKLANKGIEIVDYTEAEIAAHKKETIKHHIAKTTRRISKGTALRKWEKDVDPLKSDKIINQILKLKLDGESYQNILTIIQEEHDYSKIACAFFYQKMIDRLKQQSMELSKDTLYLHLKRYEELYKWFKEHNFHKEAMQALNHREKLVGLHSQVVEIEMNAFLLPEQRSTPNTIEHFDQGQRMRLGKLLGKAKGVE